MNILIIYYSETGNTKKIANAIQEEMISQEFNSSMKHLNEVAIEELNNYDLVFLGSACHDSDLTVPVKRILEKLPDSPRFGLAGFVTHATYTPEGGEYQRKIHEEWAGKCPQTFQQACQAKEIQWYGYFNCMGAPSPPIEAFIHREIIPEEKEWADYLAYIKDRPNSEDLEKAKEFSREVLAKKIMKEKKR